MDHLITLPNTVHSSLCFILDTFSSPCLSLTYVHLYHMSGFLTWVAVSSTTWNWPFTTWNWPRYKVCTFGLENWEWPPVRSYLLEQHTSSLLFSFQAVYCSTCFSCNLVIHMNPSQLSIRVSSSIWQQISQAGNMTKKILKAAISLAFHGLLRASEFTSPTTVLYNPKKTLLKSDITIRHHTIRLQIKASKTDQRGHRQTILLGCTNSSVVSCM